LTKQVSYDTIFLGKGGINMSVSMAQVLNEVFESIQKGDCLLQGKRRLEQLGIPFICFKEAFLATKGSDLIGIDGVPTPSWIFNISIDNEITLRVKVISDRVDGRLQWIVIIL